MTRLFDLLYYQLEKYPLEKSINGRDASGKWKSYSSQEVVEASERAASGLLGLGLKRGDKVAMVIYKNRPEWVIMDFAMPPVVLKLDNPYATALQGSLRAFQDKEIEPLGIDL